MKTIYGVQQKTESIRRAAYLLHCSLIEKKNRVDIVDYWPLPFDEDTTVINAEKLKEYQLLKARLINGN
jgi:hypothetical protein